MKIACIALLLCAGALNLSARGGEPTIAARHTPEDLEFFERKVRPLLIARCHECHSGEAKKLGGGLRLDSRARLLVGGDSGPAVKPGEPDKSLLIEAVGYAGGLFQMPPSGKLPEAEIAVLNEWVRRGSPMPNGEPEDPTPRAAIDYEQGRQFWSFQPLKETALPGVRQADWPQGRIDRFVLAALERQGLTPSPAADRRTLVRRLTFDLLGLPPTPDEVAAFENDNSQDADLRLVERLLASPHYGERWGRIWLDLVRYCDIPESWATTQAQAWRYRDWVVQAVNEDLPYDQFVRRQLAADLIEDAPPSDLAALGFLGLSPSYWKELKLDQDVIKTVVAEEWEERIHTLGSTLLGLTVGCARCHDHKFDPIGTHDYYALAGVLASTRLADRLLLPASEAKVVEEAQARIKPLQQQLDKLLAKKPASEESIAEADKLKAQVDEIKQATPHYDAPQVYGVSEASLHVLPDGADRTRLEYRPDAPQDVCVQVRGNPSNLGPAVPRRFLTVLSPGEPRTFTQGSGRLELADAMLRDAAPLMARVMVNRVWKQHFGRGLVDTPSNFGAQGLRPTHPELLDDLAARFLAAGWSLKWLHREIVLSAAYCQSSAFHERNDAIDPDNRLQWRASRRRLEVEAWRDAMLAASGQLERTLGGPPVELSSADNCRRTLYGLVKRRELPDLLRLYDFPDPTTHSPGRDATTTPLQQLFVLNGPFIQQQAAALVRRLRREAPADLVSQVQLAYSLLYQRPATERQLQAARDFLGDGNRPETWHQYAQVLLGSNEFLFVD